MEWVGYAYYAGGVLSLITSAFTTVVMLRARAVFATRAMFEEIAARIAGLEARFIATETRVEALPSANSLHELALALSDLRADLPLGYVRREDFIRNQTIIEAKLDALALKLENLQLRGIA
ncbi:MAG: DUF2730 family protein [Alphaproteobacteria bacterium]|jgi:BMFP domain-containing protein YqiC|nr:DUF2730 family protein [Alphaproteobacteria bacterium]